jgi:hypothetical protein
MRAIEKSVRVYFAAAAITLVSCGGKRNDSVSGPTNTVIEKAFVQAGLASGVPVRMMMAAGYVESGLRDNRSAVNYLKGGRVVPLALNKGESVFGFSLAELGIVDIDHADLTAQIKAYGELLKAQIGKGPSPGGFVTAEEKIRWIWKFANIHMGAQAPRNLLAVFAREMMKVLNDGFLVQNVEGTIARLEAEPNRLRDVDFPDNVKQDLTLDMYHADIRSAYLFSLLRDNPSSVPNLPTHIEVVHCPFTLSACIQLQDNKADAASPLAAHYLIPSNDEAVPGILQFYHHGESLSLLDASGQPEVVKDRIVVMLVGASGRYSEGRRNFANPMWMTDYQLRLLGAAVSEICGSLARTGDVVREECQSIGGKSGVQFRTQPADSFRWGDIADFDETIIRPYLTGSDGIAANTTLTLSPDAPVVAGSQFVLNAKFQASARRVELERLVRCPAPDNRVVWEPVEQHQIRNVTSRSFDSLWYDAGPNGTGDQFFRVKVSGESDKFLGWAIKLVQLRNFEKGQIVEASTKYCVRNGT